MVLETSHLLNAHPEIVAAVEFLAKYLEGEEEHKIDQFRKALSLALIDRYRGHWFVENPSRGNAFRCIRSVPGKMDPVLSKVSACVLDLNLTQLLPQNFSLWIDPSDVSCRLGEHGSVWSLFGNNTQPYAGLTPQKDSPTSSPSSSPSTSPASKPKSLKKTPSISFVPFSARSRSNSPPETRDFVYDISPPSYGAGFVPIDQLPQSIFQQA